MFKLVASLAIAAATLAGAPALARDPVPPTVHVTTADIDLATGAGVRLLDQRLAAAVRVACPTPLGRSLTATSDHRACLRAATRTAAEGRARVLAQVAAAPVQLAAGAR